MKAPDFAYLRPNTLEEAVAALGRFGDDARILAGGQTLMALQNFRMASAEILFDINWIPGLSDIHEEPDCLVIGSLVRYAGLEASSLIERDAPLLSEAVGHIAHPAVRNRGTIGGSLALGDPAAEMPACMLALNAEMVLCDANGERRVPADEFFLGLYETTLRPDEILTAVRIPKARPSQCYAFDEVARRRGDFALAGLAIAGKAEGSALHSVRLAYFGVADRPVLAVSAMAMLEGQSLTAELIDRVREAAIGELDPPDDPATPAAYRRHLGGVLVARLLGQLRERLL
ncbi:MAG: xanthine dehydrogenase family protein subunit M [Alphaproteobacteria bacterium]|nr:xanthine dehydrogenase family protein subunit M [Alphaproteobacteria bacterium]